MAADGSGSLLKGCLDIIRSAQTSPMPIKTKQPELPSSKIARIRRNFLQTRGFSSVLQISRFSKNRKRLDIPIVKKQEVLSFERPNPQAFILRLIKTEHSTVRHSSKISPIITPIWMAADKSMRQMKNCS